MLKIASSEKVETYDELQNKMNKSPWAIMITLEIIIVNYVQIMIWI